MRISAVGWGWAVALALGSGCAHPRTPPRHLPAWAFQSSATTGGPPRKGRPNIPAPRGGVRGRSEASDFVVAALQGAGYKFGTDGSVPALWDYLRASHGALGPTASRPGDVLFFQTQIPVAPVEPGAAATCEAPDHVGIVARVDDDGRISFVEARGGEIKRSYADPLRPRTRRDSRGRILNSVLRPKRVDEPAPSPNFAGEMVCAAARPPG